MRYFVIFLILIGFTGFSHLAYAYPVHDLDYENSPYQNKKTPSLGKPIDLFFQIGNYGPTPQNSHVVVTITNMDEHKQVYYNEYAHFISSGDTIDIRWDFTPQTSSLYLVDIIENSDKHSKYFFAVPQNDDQKRIPITNPELLDDTSPRKQFRMGIDPKLVLCENDLFLALKNDNQPVCLTLDTLVELREKEFIQGEVIDYDKIGLMLSENKFKSLLEENGIQYTQDNYMMMTGMSLTSLPPSTGYCGYVLDDEGDDYWFSSGYSFPNFHSNDLTDESPHPCKPNSYSCECEIELSLAEKNTKQLSYYDEIEVMQIGNIFRDYLNEGEKISNVPNLFTIGKYNLDLDPDVTTFCGQFQGNSWWHFQGYIKDGKIIGFSLDEKERPVLCAINEDPIVFEFEKSAIKVQTFN
jgi:hypothetical protein